MRNFMKDEQNLISTVCEYLRKFKETQHLVEPVGDSGIFKPAEPYSIRTLLESKEKIKAYHQYKIDWIKQHISESVQEQTYELYVEEKENSDLSFTDYVEEYGFSNGEIYACFDEFCNNEYEENSTSKELHSLSIVLFISDKERNDYNFESSLSQAANSALTMFNTVHTHLDYIDDNAIQLDLFYCGDYTKIDTDTANLITNSIKSYLNEAGYTNINCTIEWQGIENENDAYSLADEIEQYAFERGEYDYPINDRPVWLSNDSNRDVTAQIICSMLENNCFEPFKYYFDNERAILTVYEDEELYDCVKAQHLYSLLCYHDKEEKERIADLSIQKIPQDASYFRIYQTTNRDILFLNYDSIKKSGLSLQKYNPIYSEQIKDDSIIDNHFLDSLFHRFNVGRKPEDYKGHSLSTSDIIVVHNGKNGKSQAFFVDSFGYKDVTESFLTNAVQKKQIESER